MDLPSLAVVLRAALSHVPEERKAAEESLNQFQYTPQHLVRLLQIIVDGSCDMAVRQVASIHFKNFIAKNWSPNNPDDSPKVLESDKAMVRENILGFIVQVPPLLRAQLGESIKTIIHSDYPEQWPSLLHWVTHNLELQNQIFGALYVLRVLARKYEFKSEEERIPLYHIVEETFPRLLSIFSKLVQIVNPPIEVADLIKLICKIFWSSIYLEIPKQLFDPNVFNAWMVLFINMLERPVPVEGQPLDPEIRKSWGWWKVKKWTIHILNRLYTRFGDMKLQKPESKAFAQMFQKTYAGKILACHMQLLNAIRTGDYLPDRVINLVLQYLTNSVTKNSMYQMMQPQIDILIFEIIFPLMCFNDNDQKLWDEDPHEYVRKGYDIIEDLYSPRTAAMDFVGELVRKRGKNNLQKFIHFIVDIFRRYDEAPADLKPYRQKDGALLAIGTLCDKLKQTDPYKSELERMLVQHVFPEFNSRVGHLRAKAAWVAGQYAHINFSDPNNFRQAMHCIVSGMRDPDLPVRVDSVFALRSFVEACKDLDEIRPILPQLLDEFFKLMNEVENEDLVFTLETIVDKFGEEMAPYALGLCQNLAAAFWRCMASSEADDEADDSGALAAVGCLRAISTILESISSLPHLFIQIEPTLLPIMRRMLTSDGQDVYEEVLEIVSYMTFFSPTISLDMWSLWPLMMEALNDWAIDFFENILVPLDNYISRGTDHFLACKDPDYQQSLWNAVQSIMMDENMEDSDIEPAPKLIEVFFQNCKGSVDQWVEHYLRITIERLRRAQKPYLKCLLVQVIANVLYYNPALTLETLNKLGVAADIFNHWFAMLQQVKKSGARVNFKREHDKKVCCLGLTSLIGLPADKIPAEALDRIFKATLELLVAYKDQVAENKKQNGEAADDMDGFDADEEDDEEVDSDKEMGLDDEDGDEVSSLQLQKLASEARGFQPADEDDDSDDDFSDDEEFQSPIDEVDPFIFFVEAVQGLQASDPARFQNLMQTLDFRYQALASGIAQHAEERKVEIEKEKLEKPSSEAAPRCDERRRKSSGPEAHLLPQLPPMAPPLAAAAVSSSSPLFSPSSSRPLVRRHAPPSYVSMRTRGRSPPAAAAAEAAESSGSPLLEVRGLTASVKETGQQILAGVNLTIREGEIHAIMGKNGSGKSTLTKVLVGHPHYEVTGGTILFKGEDLVDMEPEERSIAGLFMSFQAPIEIPGVSNFDFLLMAVNARREKSGLPALGPLEFYSVVSPKVDALKMDPKFLDRNVNEGFSGGERKRNEILQLSVIGADLALLDEIDSGLDVDALEDVANAVNGLLTPQNSVLMITHYQRLLDLIKPSYVHIMENGKIIKTGDSSIATQINEGGFKSIALV